MSPFRPKSPGQGVFLPASPSSNPSSPNIPSASLPPTGPKPSLFQRPAPDLSQDMSDVPSDLIAGDDPLKSEAGFVPATRHCQTCVHYDPNEMYCEQYEFKDVQPDDGCRNGYEAGTDDESLEADPMADDLSAPDMEPEPEPEPTPSTKTKGGKK